LANSRKSGGAPLEAILAPEHPRDKAT
jgi:hypothetical protein